MRAVIIATGETHGLEKLNDRIPTPLIPLVDRPFIQHIIEQLVESGVTVFEFILCHLPERIESFLGDGTRWGCRFTFHLVRDAYRPYQHVTSLLADATEAVILLHADRLLPGITPALLHTAPTTLCMHTPADAPTAVWTGWAVVSPAALRALPADACEEDLSRALSAMPGTTVHHTPAVLDIRSYDGILAAQRWLLAHQASMLLTGTEADSGVRLSRNVTLHPTARIQPPVFIGENCVIGPRAQLGPDVVVGSNTILEAECVVRDALVFPWSYIGEALDVEHALVDRNRLINVHLDVAVEISDAFILGTLARNTFGHALRRLVGRLVAVLLFIATVPVLVIAAAVLSLVRRGSPIYRRSCVQLPASLDDALWRTHTLHSFAPPGQIPLLRGWRHLLAVLLPGLWDVVRGHVRFVGVLPKTAEELRALPPDWRALYTAAEAGIITEAMFASRSASLLDEQYAAESMFAVQDGVYNDLRLIAAYLLRLIV